MMKQKWTLASFILSIALVFSFTFWFGLTPKDTLVETSELESAPDYFLEEVEAKTFNEQGYLIETLTATELKHFPVAGESRLIKPIITKEQNNSLWTAQGDTGLIKDEEKDLIFNGSAKVVNQPNSQTASTITSNTIIYTDKDASVTSIGNAILNTPQGKVTADSITAYTQSSKVILQGSVRGSYEQNR